MDANLKDLEAEVVGMTKRLFDQEWVTGKISAVLLVPVFYGGVSPNGQKELIKVFNSSLITENVMQRKTNAMVLNQLIELLPKTPEADLLAAFKEL